MIELLFVLFFGLVFGSFITCASYRLPREEDVVLNPSYCPVCNTRLTFKDLWPVLSWMQSKGKCRHCGAKIHWRYPAIEVFTAATFLWVYSEHGLTLQAVVLALFAVALLIMIVVDFEHYIIPDEIHIALLPLAFVYHYSVGTGMTAIAASAGVGGAIGLALHHGYRFFRGKEGLGYGDVKFLAIAGLWLGNVFLFPPFLFLAGMLGVATGVVWRFLRRGERFPFGPALAAALFLCVAMPRVPGLFWGVGESLLINLY